MKFTMRVSATELDAYDKAIVRVTLGSVDPPDGQHASMFLRVPIAEAGTWTLGSLHSVAVQTAPPPAESPEAAEWREMTHDPGTCRPMCKRCERLMWERKLPGMADAS